MLNRLSINLRVLMLILVPTAIFIIIGYISFFGFNNTAKNIDDTDKNLITISIATDLNSKIDQSYDSLLTDLKNGYFSWEATKERVIKDKEIILEKISAFNKSLSKNLFKPNELVNLSNIQKRFETNYNYIHYYLTTRKGTNEDIGGVSEFLIDTQLNHSQDMRNSLNLVSDKVFKEMKGITTNIIEVASITSKKIIFALTIGALFMILIGFFIAKSIKKPTFELTNVVNRLSNGEFDARANVIGSDEIANLSEAFNSLLNDRAKTHAEIDAEHKELNQSVFNLLQTVAELSERDLTIRAKVTEDATGPVADALNLLAEETSDTLRKVKEVAANVNRASSKVNTHLMSINKLAMKDRESAKNTVDQMDVMRQRLDTISNTAADTNVLAGRTKASTQSANESVTDTLAGMSDIRTTVQDTGKRIKRLGERSQEISHVIEIIETIAERTTLLALNASMQAASAGNEGKGFSIIAEEIQRLAQSSSESTGKISTLVSNIQKETNMTIETMDKTIEKVVDSSVKAADAIEQMKSVSFSTNELVNAVDQIATASLDQVSISENLKSKAENILNSTKITGQELLSLTSLSRNMSEYAQQLVTSVDLFKLEEDKDWVNDLYLKKA